MIKLTLILDQIQAGVGTKDDGMMTLGGKTTAIGPALMMEPFLKKEDMIVNACLYCGNQYFEANKEAVKQKIVAMTTKMATDIVLCGPAFDFAGYAQMATNLGLALNQAGKKAFVALAPENNEELIYQFKDKLFMVKMPKKGGIGLNTSLENMCRFASAFYANTIDEPLKKELCY